jgi:hypothetical protein
MTSERAELLRKATAASVLDHLRAAGGSVPSSILALGLAEALATMLGHVAVKHRAEVAARCRAALDAVERRQPRKNNEVEGSAAVTR